MRMRVRAGNEPATDETGEAHASSRDQPSDE